MQKASKKQKGNRTGMEKQNKELNSSKKKVTIIDIAREAGVSPSMVSRVVSGNGVVSEKNKVRIQELLDKYNYKPNAFARGLQKSKTGLIGFIIPHIGNEYFSSVYYEFERCASEYGYMTIVYNGKSSLEVESRIFSALEEVRVEAAIMMGGRIDAIELEERYIEEVKQFGQSVHSILCTEQAGRFQCPGVHHDEKKACELVGRYLKEKEYRSAGILGGSYGRFPTKNKITFMLEEFRKAGIENRKGWNIGDSYNEIDGAQSMRQLLQQEEIPEVVVCINDHVAFGAMMEAKDAGLRIPEDISIIGSDGVGISKIGRPAITTIQIDFKKYGETLFDTMVAAIEGRECAPLRLIESSLVVRESSR